MSTTDESLVATGVAGLDDILHGGFVPNRLHLVQGTAGAGKTTLALQFLLQGERAGERSLYVTLSETRAELMSIGKSHGFAMESLHIFEFLAFQDNFRPEAQYTVFHPSDVELTQTVKAFMDEAERIQPVRVALDSLSEMRLLAQDPLRFRRHILALKQFFAGRGCTVLLLDDHSPEQSDVQLESIAHGVITLEQLAPEYGAERRRLRVRKMRGRNYRGGYHDFRIERGGLVVFPRLVAAEHQEEFEFHLIKSGMENLDQLLGGGIHSGTSTLLMGPAGTGKTSLAVQYAISVAKEGERAAIFTFDEGRGTFITRCDALGLPLRRHLADGMIQLHQVDPGELSPGEFIWRVRDEVDKGAKVVMIDSLNGFLNAMPEERFLIIQLHELLSYMSQKGVASFLIVAQHGLLGAAMKSPVDTSYLADTVVLLRYFETAGEVRKAISVLKKRSGPHEKSIRELTMGNDGLTVGETLHKFRGVLTGVPQVSFEENRPEKEFPEL
jgi:circadian clock protein KaiC